MTRFPTTVDDRTNLSRLVTAAQDLETFRALP
jgi:hypothetical protein